MPPKKEKKRKTTIKAKASAKSIVNINIGRGKSTPKRQAKPTVPSAKKAEVVQNVIRTSPTIFNPAPTPFQISAPQPKPFSSAAEIAEEVKRLVRTDYERAVQQPEIMRLPSSALPTGSSIVEPQFNNMEVPTSFTELETPPPKKKQRTPKQRAQDKARMMGLSTVGTEPEILQRIGRVEGRIEREEEIVGMAKEMIKKGKEGKAPFV